jgi:hypothetical protein
MSRAAELLVVRRAARKGGSEAANLKPEGEREEREEG